MNDSEATEMARTDETCQLFAAIHFADGYDVDRLIDQVIVALKSRGTRLAGYLQRETPAGDDCCSTLYLESIEDGKKAQISQALGAGSKGCRLDPAALAVLSNQLRDAINTDTDMLIVNRFGKGESDGQGFRIVMERAMELGVPVLTAVRDDYLDAWHEFCGEFGLELEPQPEHVLEWCDTVLALESQ
jgi:nucleoside-triphosphatase THEP1